MQYDLDTEIRLRGVKHSVRAYMDTDYVRADFVRQLMGETIMPRAIHLAAHELADLLKLIGDLHAAHVTNEVLTFDHHDPGQCALCVRSNAARTLLWSLQAEAEEQSC